MFDKINQLKGIEGKYEDIMFKYSKVILSKIIKKFIEAEKALQEYNIRRYLQISFYEIFNLIQDFFRDTENKNDFIISFKTIYTDWLKILSLTMPHLCEELWEIAGNSGFISTAIWGDFNKKFIDNDLEREFDYITNVIEDILNIRKIVKTRKSDKIYIYTAPKWKYRVLKTIIAKRDDFEAIISEIKNDKELISNKQLIPYIKSQLKDRIWGKKLPQIDEINSLNQYKSYMERRVNSNIEINSEFDPKKRAIKANPFKPALYIDV